MQDYFRDGEQETYLIRICIQSWWVDEPKVLNDIDSMTADRSHLQLFDRNLGEKAKFTVRIFAKGASVIGGIIPIPDTTEVW